MSKKIIPNPSSAHRRRAASRLAQCRLLDDQGVPNTDKAIHAAMAKGWTAAHAARFGPAASSRSLRRWRLRLGAMGARTLADMTDLPRRRRPPDPRLATLTPHVSRAMVDRSATVRELHDLHVRDIHAGRGIGVRAVPCRPLSYETVRKIVARARRETDAAPLA